MFCVKRFVLQRKSSNKVSKRSFQFRNQDEESLIQRGRRYGGRIRNNTFPSSPFSSSSSSSTTSSSFLLRLLSAGGLASISGFLIYDGIRNDFVYCGAARRFLRSLKTAVQITIDYVILNPNDPDYEVKLKHVHQTSANRLLDTCLRNGGLYIKVGQGIAAINHILPPEYTSTLAQLQDSCLPSSREDVQKVFLQELGRLPEDIYREFDYEPVAAASIAQVFKAKLPNNEPVAVKVQYADLQKRFVSDLGTIIFLHDIIEIFFKDYNFGWILRDVQKNLVQELNFEIEAKNAELCANHLESMDFVHVPYIHWSFSTKRILTLEWIDGYKLDDIQSIKKKSMCLKDIDRKLYKMFAVQIFHSGFVHADPHPSNVMVRRSPRSGKAQLVLLDHGLYETITQCIRTPLCEFWEATVLRDEEGMNRAARKLGIRNAGKFAEVLFQQPIRLQGGHLKSKLSSDDIEHMQRMAQDNFDEIMSTLKEMPRNMLFVVRNLNTVRAIGRMHGDVVDRPHLMAKYAQNSLYVNCPGIRGYCLWLYRRLYLEYYFWTHSIKRSCLNLYFNLLYRLGRAPKEATTILNRLMHIHD